jgi:hypothetical protein
MATEEHKVLLAVNVSVDWRQEMAGFEVSINGRFWVSTEVFTDGSNRRPLRRVHVGMLEHHPNRAFT